MLYIEKIRSILGSVENYNFIEKQKTCHVDFFPVDYIVTVNLGNIFC